MARRPRGLHPDEQALWQRIAGSARAMHPDHPRRADPAATPKARPPRPDLTPLLHFAPARRPPGVTLDLAPGPEERLKAQPLRMSRRAHEAMTRGRLRPEARIDLHGLTLSQAHPALIRFVLSSQSAGLRLVLVITGKGRPGDDDGPIPQRVGVLRQQVPHWLSQPPMAGAVLQVTPAHLRHGGGGALYVYLRRLRPAGND